VAASARMPRYQPPDPFAAPRYTGIRTYARVPHVTDPEGVDVAVVGVPFDTATSFRAGARHGPEGIRAGSALLRPWHPQLGVDVFASQSVVDWGDLHVTPGNIQRTLDQIAEGLAPLLDAGIVPIVLGGDHSIVLAELRAHARKHGPLALVLLDAHADVWDAYYGERYFHGTPFRRAVEEGLLQPERSLLAGMRGSLYGPEDVTAATELGFEVLGDVELRKLGVGEYGGRVRERVGDGPAFLSFDIDVIDPAFAPGTGTPEVGGPTSSQALAYVRALTGIDFRGFDCVEVAPAYDAGAITAWLAASVCHEMISLRALQ
jgi:agmatinase